MSFRLMRRALMAWVAVLGVAACVAAQEEWELTAAAEGLKGPVRSVMTVQLDSSTAHWEDCRFVPPTFVETSRADYAPDGWRTGWSYNNRDGVSILTTFVYDEERRLTRVVGMRPDRRECADYHWKDGRLDHYITQAEGKHFYASADTFRCEYDSLGGLRYVRRVFMDSSLAYENYENGFLAGYEYDEWSRAVYVRDSAGRPLRVSHYEYRLGDLEERDSLSDDEAFMHGVGDTVEWLVREYTWSEDGELMQESTAMDGHAYTVVYTYADCDRYGNWLRRKATGIRMDGSVMAEDWVRIITYYVTPQ